jgi:hypothetical protein
VWLSELPWRIHQCLAQPLLFWPRNQLLINRAGYRRRGAVHPLIGPVGVLQIRDGAEAGAGKDVVIPLPGPGQHCR